VISIPAGDRRLVIGRAGGRCEYCGLAQIGQEATFHIDHVVPLAAGGETTPSNLALAVAIRDEEARAGRHPQPADSG
jgi:hypothetical protein